MKNYRALLLLLLLLNSGTHVVGVPLSEFLPWLSPNQLVLGTRVADFLAAHRTAKKVFPSDDGREAMFNGALMEELGDGKVMIYTFVNDELASVAWASKPPVETESILAIRSALVQSHGDPMVENTARIDSQGSAKKIEREVYTPSLDKNCVVCLMATSSDGIEVTLTNNSIYLKHGRPIIRQTYEDAVQSISSAVKINDKPSSIVDILAAVRIRADRPAQKDNLQSASLRNTSKQPSTETSGSILLKPGNLAMKAKPRNTTWLWFSVVILLIAIAALAWRRKSS